MKSVKPGRGPSFMGGISAAAVGVFGVLWTVGAASMGAPVIFPLFGIVFIVVAVCMAAYHFKNATSGQRYSAFDIVEGDEEQDPLNVRFGQPVAPPRVEGQTQNRYCPYCGNALAQDFAFCNRCGKKLPV